MIIHAIIIMTHDGIPYFEYGKSASKANNILVGGYSSALSSVWTHFTQNDIQGFEHLERIDHDICLTAHRTQCSTMLIITDSKPHNFVLDKIKRVHRTIERDFQTIVDSNNNGIFKELPKEQIISILTNSGLRIHSS